MLVVAVTRAAGQIERFPAELDRYIESGRERWQIPGIAIAVVRNDSTLVAKGYGVRQLGKPGRVDENTVFDIASLTKSFTAATAAIMVDRGVLRWDDPVRRYLPDLVLPTDSLTRMATVRDFLSHRTGLDPANTMWVPTAVDRAELLRRMRYLRPVAPFRQTMVYSNVGYVVAGEAIAAAARTPLESLFRDLLIKPLGMSSTTWTYEQTTSLPNVAAPHAKIAKKEQVIPRELQRRTIAAAAAVQSSAHDLARWMRLHLNNGVLDGKRFISDSSMREMHRIQARIPTTPAMRAARLVQDTVIGYGMGWQVMDYRGHRVWWHTGNGNGQISYMALFPDDRLGIVVLVNTWSAPNVHGALVNRIADAYLGFPPRDWVAETLARLPAQDSARDAYNRAMITMRSSATPSLPLDAYAGRYEHPLFGPVWIRRAGSGLTLQMGSGQIADLEYHGADSFFVIWRDPFFRETYPTHVTFTGSADSVVSFTTTMNRDSFTARKGAPGPAYINYGAFARDTAGNALIGKWNLRLLAVPDVFSSWLEVERSGSWALVGRFVGLIGGARPISRVEWKNGVARFTIPSEWEWPAGDLHFEIRLQGDSLVGTMVRTDGSPRAFVGKRAPILRRAMPTQWTAPVPLFNGKDLSGWTVAPTARSLPNFWKVRDCVMVNDGEEGANLMTVHRFQDFRLHAEYRLPKGSSSGIFPRGRYWVILGTRTDTVPFNSTTGAVHKFLLPNQNAAYAPDTWHAIDITLVGRQITIVLNGKTVIADQIIPGITGSAIDTDEESPGPIMIQGEEQRVEFRNIAISVPTQTASNAAASNVGRRRSCATDDSAAAVGAVRGRLAEWVRQANANDLAGMNEVWAPGLVGWFPSARLFSDSAARAAAGFATNERPPAARAKFELVIDDIVASGPIVAVHDVWTETRDFRTRKVRRVIRGSELWRCQPDGNWRIARYVSAPEAWR